MDLSKYRDIAPYRGDDFKAAIQRLLDGVEYLGEFISLLSGSDDEQKTLEYTSLIMHNISKVTDYDSFLRNITAGLFIPTVIKRTMTEFTASGAENLDPKKGYLFISNHRDIILDCALLDYALLLADRQLCEMAFGDNLIINQFTEDLFRLNGGVVIRRELPMREKYLESIRISEYFVDVVTEMNKPIWVAQKSGRSKDGIDETQPAIIKMLYLSKKGSGISFQELINSMNIVPVAVSYEYDPNDINKGREEILRKAHDGAYEKKRYEDLISMARGMKCQKGRVHMTIGKPLHGDFADANDVAREIDRQIHLGYKLWDTNLFAYSYLENDNRFASDLSEFDGDAFLARFSHLSPDVRDFVLNSYANPVRMAIKEGR